MVMLLPDLRPGSTPVPVPNRRNVEGSVDVDKVLERFKRAKSQKERWRDLLEDVYRYFMPNRNQFTEYTPGQRQTNFVLDSTAVKASQRLAGRLQATMVPAFRQWGKLEAGSEVPKDHRARVNEWLEEQTEIMFDHLDQSNFATAAHESFFDLIAGTGVLLEKDGTIENPVEFTSVNLREIYPEEGPQGAIETIFREHEMSARNIMRNWPMAKLPMELEDDLKNAPEREYTVIEGSIFDPIFRDNVSVVILPKTKQVLLSAAQDISDWIVFRWSKNPGETLGRGPAMNALPTVRTLNAVMEFTLQNAQMAIAPPILTTPEGVINPGNFLFEPGGINMVKQMGETEMMQGNHRFDVSNMLIKEMREEVEKTMFVFNLGPVDSPVRSATEMLLRNKDLMEDIGSSFSRLSFELQFKVVRRTVDILSRAGKMAPISVDGKAVTVKYIGPLAQAQDQADLVAFQQYWEIMSAVGPEASTLATKVEDVGQYVAGKLGVPQSLLRDQAERDQLVKLATEQAQAQAQAQQQAAAPQPAPGPSPPQLPGPA